LRQTRYHVVIFGHSHKFDYRRFGDHGEYFNTGTWTEVISLDVGKLGRSYLRPYVRIDYDDGKPRASLHNWIGSHRLTHRLIS
jgi:predicted phosphodiesterase